MCKKYVTGFPAPTLQLIVSLLLISALYLKCTRQKGLFLNRRMYRMTLHRLSHPSIFIIKRPYFAPMTINHLVTIYFHMQESEMDH